MLSRRAFLKRSLAAAVAALGLGFTRADPGKGDSVNRPTVDDSTHWPDGGRLGRVTAAKLERHTRPTPDSPLVDTLYEDDVVEWLSEVVGEAPPLCLNRRWVETPEGYLYGADLQPVFNRPNTPLAELPENPAAGRGLWAEVSLPYVAIRLDGPPASHWIKVAKTPRLYYSQVFWVDDLKTGEDGLPLYHVSEKYGLDSFWAAAAALRPLAREELEPIHPGVAGKKVLVNLAYQTLACLEGKDEVYFCRISSGTRFGVDESGVVRYATPTGPHPIWRKLISHHMSAGSAQSGYDLPGIAWTCLFSGDGVAIHSTYWHNDFGTPLSHGCINAAPEDAKWVFRWSEPHIPYEEGDRVIGLPGGTVVDVIAG